MYNFRSVKVRFNMFSKMKYEGYIQSHEENRSFLCPINGQNEKFANYEKINTEGFVDKIEDNNYMTWSHKK